MQVSAPLLGPNPPQRGNHRPADPGLSPAEDPVDTCTLSRRSFEVPGESQWKMQRALADSNYSAQRGAAEGLLAKARRNELLSADEEASLREMVGSPQANGSLQVSAWHKSEQSLGPATAYQKTEFGYEPGKGTYAATQRGAEVKLGVPGLGPSATLFTRHTLRPGQAQAETQTGVEVEKSLGPAAVGWDASQQGVDVYAKLETPAIGGQRVGAGVSASLPSRGNARAREAALAALHQQTTNQVARNWGLH